MEVIQVKNNYKLTRSIVWTGNSNTWLHYIEGCFIKSHLVFVLGRKLKVKVPPRSRTSATFNYLVFLAHYEDFIAIGIANNKKKKNNTFKHSGLIILLT